jgi:hypothetical protein
MPDLPPAKSPGAPGPAPGRGRRTLLLIAAVVVAPIAAAYVAYYLYPRDQRVNYGTLVPTVPAPAIVGTRDDGSRFHLEDLHGRWVLLVSGRGECASACERKLYAIRQARTMQGRDQDRIVRVWIVVGDTPPAATLLAKHPGLVVVRAAEASPAMPSGGAASLDLIDPLGNLVLRFPDDPDVKGIADDLARLLKASRIG